MNRWCTSTRWLFVPLMMLFAVSAGMAQTLTSIGGFESNLPSYWTKGNEPAGASLSWATDQSHSMGHSLKITKSATSDSAAWISQNMCDLWSATHGKNVDIFVGASVKTQGVNTNPTTEDQKWYVSYTFYDSAGALIGTTKLPINQTTATSTGWLADTNAVGQTILPKDSWKTIVKFVGGKNATGTVWADDFVFYGRAGAWAGQDWNTQVGVPTGWFYWLPQNGGNDGLLNDGFENTVVTTEAAHTGLSSLKFNLPFNRTPHDGFIGTRRYTLNNLGAGSGLAEGDVVRISVWIKASSLVPDSAAMYPGTWSVGFTPIWSKGYLNNDAYDEIGASDNVFVFPPVTAFDWTQYTLDVTVPTGQGVKALSVRLHVYSRFTGTIYFDDLTVEKLDIPQLTAIGGFESNLPSYWTKGNEPAGASLSWATDQSHSMGHSLKITKSATSDSAAWISQNMCDLWSATHGKNVDIFVGASVKTQGVNTNPTTEDQKWYVSYTFYDSAGALIGTTKLPINQTTATSTGWLADTNAVGQTILPKDSWKTIVKFVGGKNATGTVWADDFVFYGRAGAWAGQDWNTQVGVPTGWFYWLPQNGGNDGLLNDGFENTVVTTEAAHTGLSSLKFNLPFNRTPHDGFIGTRRYALTGTTPGGTVGGAAVPNDITSLAGVKEGDVVRISVWIKASSLVPDSAAMYPGTWSVGFTPIWSKGYLNNDAYDEIGASDNVFVFPPVTAFDWTQYTLDVTVPTGQGVKALSVRLHVYSRFTGTIYFDDLTVEKLDIPQLTAIGGFESNLPSYWTKGNEPAGASLSWATDQSHSMGHSLKITKSATSDSAAWISQNMCDLWSATHGKNVDIFVGASVKTQGVNTNPTTEDQKWYVSYTFYDSAGALIGTTKLPINQTTATSTGWLADTNAVGQTILPKDSWKTIVKFVGGKNATGTVWADDFVFYGRAGAWAGQDWNTQVGVPTGWFYWLPQNGGNDGLLNDGFENTVVTTEAAHTGLSSLKFNLPFNRTPHDGFIGTRRYALTGTTPGGTVGGAAVPNDITSLAGVKEGDVVRISVWIKASNLVPDSAAMYPGTWSVGFTPIWSKGYLNNDAYDEIGASDNVFVFPPVTAFDWTQYTLDVTVPTGQGVKALSVRLHVYSRFTGTIYFDDLTVRVVGSTTGVAGKSNTPKTFELSENYPNPFNPSTTIRFAVPTESNISLVIYNVLGQEVRTLLDEHKSAGNFTAVWDGRDNMGRTVGSGVYFYRLNTGSIALVKKMVMLK